MYVWKAIRMPVSRRQRNPEGAGRIPGDQIELPDQKVRILDNGRTLVDDANNTFTR